MASTHIDLPQLGPTTGPITVEVSATNDSILVRGLNFDNDLQTLRLNDDGAVVVDGIYDALDNVGPSNVGLIGHERAVGPGAAQQKLRLTALAAGSITALDTNVTTSVLPTGAGTETTLLAISGKLNSLSVSASIQGLSNFQTSQYTVGTSAVPLTPTPLANRTAISIKVSTTSNQESVYVGSTNGVTTSTGYALFDGDSIQLDITNAHAVYAIASAAGQRIYVLEIGN